MEPCKAAVRVRERKGSTAERGRGHAIFLMTSARLRVRPMGVHRTCGPANEMYHHSLLLIVTRCGILRRHSAGLRSLARLHALRARMGVASYVCVGANETELTATERLLVVTGSM